MTVVLCMRSHHEATIRQHISGPAIAGPVSILHEHINQITYRAFSVVTIGLSPTYKRASLCDDFDRKNANVLLINNNSLFKPSFSFCTSSLPSTCLPRLPF